MEVGSKVHECNEEPQCEGDGECLEIFSFNDYYRKLSCRYNCQPSKCPNHEMCYGWYSQYCSEFWGGYCAQCAGKGVGMLKKNYEKTDCEHCRKVGTIYMMPCCSVSLCHLCTKELFLGLPTFFNIPRFYDIGELTAESIELDKELRYDRESDDSGCDEPCSEEKEEEKNSNSCFLCTDPSYPRIHPSSPSVLRTYKTI